MKWRHARARPGEHADFTGSAAPYEAPQSPDLLLRPPDGDPAALAQIVFDRIEHLL